MGEIVNYMQLDSARLEHVAHNIHTVWDGMLQVRGFWDYLESVFHCNEFMGLLVFCLWS